jgi:hypothetical protein
MADETFNPHGNTDSMGKVIQKGDRVRDHDWKIGTVVSDRDLSDLSECRMQEFCNGDHWFDVQRDDGTTSMMNGERLRILLTRTNARGLRETYHNGAWHIDPEN